MLADGVWLQWGSWSACSVTCGDGTRDRHRDCYYQPEVPQTEPCLGATSEQIFCNNDTCPGKNCSLVKMSLYKVCVVWIDSPLLCQRCKK